MNYLYATDISGISWSQMKHKINILSPCEARRICSLKKEKDRCLSLGGKILLMHVLSEQIGWEKDFLPELSYTIYHKPYIKGISGFNISHAGNMIVCAYNPDGDAGIDIEKKVQDICLDEYIPILTVDEYNRLRNGNISDFFKLWTIKEAIIKADGRGFFLDPSTININLDFSHDLRITIDEKQWFIFSSEINDVYVVTVASTNPDNPELRYIPDGLYKNLVGIN